jgi:hypothetical protein
VSAPVGGSSAIQKLNVHDGARLTHLIFIDVPSHQRGRERGPNSQRCRRVPLLDEGLIALAECHCQRRDDGSPNRLLYVHYAAHQPALRATGLCQACHLHGITHSNHEQY